MGGEASASQPIPFTAFAQKAKGGDKGWNPPAESSKGGGGDAWAPSSAHAAVDDGWGSAVPPESLASQRGKGNDHGWGDVVATSERKAKSGDKGWGRSADAGKNGKPAPSASKGKGTDQGWSPSSSASPAQPHKGGKESEAFWTPSGSAAAKIEGVDQQWASHAEGMPLGSLAAPPAPPPPSSAEKPYLFNFIQPGYVAAPGPVQPGYEQYLEQTPQGPYAYGQEQYGQAQFDQAQYGQAQYGQELYAYGSAPGPYTYEQWLMAQAEQAMAPNMMGG